MTRERTETSATAFWVFAWTVALIVMLLANLGELLASLQRLDTLDHRAWGYTEDAKRAIRFLEKGEIVGRFAAMAGTLHLFVLLRRRDPGWPGWTIAYGIAYVVFQVAVDVSYLRFPPSAPQTYLDAYRMLAIVHAAVVAGALAFLARSTWARRTFVGRVVEPPATRPQLVGAGIALIAWPFVANTLTDTSTFLAGLLCPLSVTDGGTGSMVLIGLSLGYGLHQVLRHGLRMPTGWVVLVLPLGFAALIVSFWLMSFAWHYRF